MDWLSNQESRTVHSSKAGSALPDEELVARSRAGDRAAFGALFARYHRPVLAMCTRRIGDPSAAEDVAQETFLRAFIHLRGYDPERPFYPWLKAIALNAATDYWDRARRLQPAGLHPTEFASDGVEAFERILQRDGLRRAFDALPDRQRTALLRHVLDDWDCARLAREEGSSDLAVWSLLFRARQALRKRLAHALLVVIAIRARLRGQPTAASPTVERALEAVAAAGLALIVTASSVAPIPAAAYPAAVPLRARRAPVEHLPQVSVVLPSRAPHAPAPTPAPIGVGVRSRTGAPAPPKGTLTIVVTGPDGRRVWWSETEIECEAVGADDLPDAGPFSSVC